MKLANIFRIDFDQNRVFELDILRMVAILLVVIAHSLSFMPSGISKLIDRFLLDGVGIFFVLSGFLIGKILIRLLKRPTLHGLILKYFG